MHSDEMQLQVVEVLKRLTAKVAEIVTTLKLQKVVPKLIFVAIALFSVRQSLVMVLLAVDA